MQFMFNNRIFSNMNLQNKQASGSITLFLIIVAFLSPLTLSSQNTGYGIPQTEYYSRQQYNAASQTWDITQSNIGILYFANNDGVLEYDGTGWNLVRDTRPYISRSVTAVGDRIYTGTYSELGYFSYEGNQDLKYISLVKNDELRSYADYWNIHDLNGNIIFHSEKALCIFENDSLIGTIPAFSRFIGSFLVNGMLIVQDETEGVMELRGEQVYHLSGSGILKDKVITSMVPLSNDTIVIGTMRNGLYIWDMQTVSRWDVPSARSLEEANIYCGIEYEDKYLVFGTIQSGVVITDKSGNIVYQIGKDKGLVNNTVLSLFADKDGNVWGGLNNGIVKINLRSSINFLQGYYDLGTGYAVERVNDTWYFGTNQGLFTISSETFASPLKNRDDFINVAGIDGQVWNLCRTGNTLLCGHNLGVFEIKGERADLITPPSVNGVWLLKEVPGREDCLIAGTFNGLILLERKDSEWKYKASIKGFDESSRYMEWSPDGYLWISHGYKGVFRLKFDEQLENVVRLDTIIPENSPVFGSSPVISNLDDRIVVTTTTGIFHMTDSDSIERYNGLDLYFEDDYPDRIIQDRYRNIWYFMDSSVGLLRFLEDGTYKNIKYPFIPLENKLVPSFESVYVINNQNILVGVEDGFAHYTVSEGTEFYRPFKIHIRSFKGRSDTISYVLNQVGDKTKSLQETIPEYKFRDNLFEIHYAATYFREGHIEYSTYLSNYDLEATSWNSNTSRQFAKLKEGDYQFVVKARNSFGVQSEPLLFQFRVLPPWYRTIIAKIIYMTLILLIMLLNVYIFNHRVEINKQREKLKQQESYRAREEKLKNEALEKEKELIRMRNERLRSEMIFKEKELANSTMNILQKNKSLMKIKSNMAKINSLGDESEIKKQIKRLITQIEKDIDSEDYWKVFEVHLEQVHEAFLKRLFNLYPNLTNREAKLCAYIRMGMSSKEIAALTNISYRAVENNRYRLRQKLKLGKGENLSQYLSDL